jgi:hypothetical protein
VSEFLFDSILFGVIVVSREPLVLPRGYDELMGARGLF